MIIEVLKGNSTVTSVDVVSSEEMMLHVLHLLHELIFTEQDGTSISEEVKREINDLVERNREANEITFKDNLFEYKTCERIDLSRVRVRCMS